MLGFVKPTYVNYFGKPTQTNFKPQILNLFKICRVLEFIGVKLTMVAL